MFTARAALALATLLLTVCLVAAQPSKTALTYSFFSSTNCTGDVELVYTAPGNPTAGSCAEIAVPLNTCTPSEIDIRLPSYTVTCSPDFAPSYPPSAFGIFAGSMIYADTNCSDSQALRYISIKNKVCAPIPDGVGLPFQFVQGQCSGPTGPGYILTYSDKNCTKPATQASLLPLDGTCVASNAGSLANKGRE
jgi:hypothetical protein